MGLASHVGDHCKINSDVIRKANVRAPEAIHCPASDHLRRQRCSVHPGMQATVIAADSPLAAVSDEGGRFAIANVSAGAYTLSVTFEGRTVTTAVDVKGPRTDVRVTR